MPQAMPKNGEIYRHFKGGFYRVETVATHTETGEALVIYQALYGDFKTYARPLAMFLSEVDRDKYPDAKQRFRFALVEPKSVRDARQAAAEKAVEEQKAGVGARQAVAKAPVAAAKEPEAPVAAAREPKKADSEPAVHPKLMEFLDAKRMEERYNVLVSMRDCVTDAMINTMAVVLDVTIPEGDLQDRYEQLKICVRTKRRYEAERL